MQEADRVSAVLPQQEPPVHHALADARHDLRIAAAIGLIEGRPRDRNRRPPLTTPPGPEAMSTVQAGEVRPLTALTVRASFTAARSP